MKIRTQFIASIILFAVILMTLATSLILVTSHIELYNQQEELVNNIERSARELGYTANSYLLYGESQLHNRWESTFDELSTDLSNLNDIGDEEQVVVNSIKTDLAGLSTIFADVSASIERNSRTPGGFFDRSFIQVSWSRLEVQNQAVVFDASRLSSMIDSRLARERQISTNLIFALAILFAIYVFSTYLLLFRRTLKSLYELREGTRVIGSGNLDYIVPEKHKDEVGDLSRAFNRMTTELKMVTTSKVDMEKEIKERKTAEEALKKSEEKYRTLFNSMTEGFALHEIILDASGKPCNYRFLELNDAFEKLTGLSYDKVVGKTVKEVLPDVESFWVEIYGRVALSGEPAHFENYSAPLNRWYEVFAYSPARNQFAVLFEDITERKKTEEELKESEERFRALSETSPIGVGVSSADGVLLYTNPSYERILGYKRAELVGKKASELDWNPEDRRSWAGTMKENRAIRNVEIRLKRKDGTPVWVAINASPIIYGGTQAVMGTIQDITEHKKAEVEMAYRATFPELNPNPIIELDKDGHITYLNPAAKTVFPDLQDQGMEHPFLAGMEIMVSEMETEKVNSLIRDIQLGDSWYERSTFHIPINQNLRIYSRDITARKKVEQIKDEFIGMVSHEIKTPLTVIIGSLLVATSGRIAESEVKDLLHEAIIHADELADLTDNLLELSRSQSNRLLLGMEQSDISIIANEVVQKLRQKSALHNLVLEIPSNIPGILVDPLRIQRILHNLIDNAIKYSPQGGDVKVFSRAEDSKLIIGVRDQGLGISIDDQQKLFKHFERIDAYEKYSIPGLGLGLRVCQILVEAHGGNIWLESEPGKGSTFFFSIPISNS